ncbi:methylated-DNA--[protein]-cysteine S-methyltransferase [Pusillimonas sp. SM2304]|uniref:methylated-DNA--[protein]-cysteine S-methyltransferase n=1 Tax=Pusillimonas sp. SM2304 TaxID=3073241 RepID=UPI00287445F5|nr:methylated-DNA--[protein]-cysteine S-methyltransferase [Pusillimonas sp. SM2304]MDS1141518.1 methylated-DNA--[protein]-cysteine S-methyltransferase [Pusillimonas sp. SM2304]
MTFYAQITSPLGPILLSSNGACLDGLYFVGQSDCPSPAGAVPVKPGKADPTAGMRAGVAIKNLKAYKNPPAAPTLFDEQDLRPTGLAGCDDGACAIKPAPADRAGLAHQACGPVALKQAGTPGSAVALFEQTRRELDEYFLGRRKVFTVPLQLDGTEFQVKVWQALLTIPYGEYVSYGDVAQAAGLKPQHGRPVGTAVGRNPITIIVPCHRVLAGTGRLNGYTGGLERKFALLELEGFTLG